MTEFGRVFSAMLFLLLSVSSGVSSSAEPSLRSADCLALWDFTLNASVPLLPEWAPSLVGGNLSNSALAEEAEYDSLPIPSHNDTNALLLSWYFPSTTSTSSAAEWSSSFASPLNWYNNNDTSSSFCLNEITVSLFSNVTIVLNVLLLDFLSPSSPSRLSFPQPALLSASQWNSVTFLTSDMDGWGQPFSLSDPSSPCLSGSNDCLTRGQHVSGWVWEIEWIPGADLDLGWGSVWVANVSLCPGLCSLSHHAAQLTTSNNTSAGTATATTGSVTNRENKPSSLQGGSSSTPSGALVGGVVGSISVLILILSLSSFAFSWYQKRQLLRRPMKRNAAQNRNSGSSFLTAEMQLADIQVGFTDRMHTHAHETVSHDDATLENGLSHSWEKRRKAAMVDTSGWILIDDICVGESLGVGQFGEVFKGTWQGTTTVALKSLRSEKHLREFAREVCVLHELNHPNIVRLLGVHISHTGTHTHYVVMEYLTKGGLPALLARKKDTLPTSDLLAMAKDAAAGMAYLEEQKIVHRNLALRNFLATTGERRHRYRVKVSDFGLSRSIAEDGFYATKDGSIPIDTVRWCAPEIFQQGMNTAKSDIWAFGIVLWEMFSYGASPYAWLTNQEVPAKILSGYRLDRPNGCPGDVYNLMLKCWLLNPNDRPGFKELFLEIKELRRAYRV